MKNGYSEFRELKKSFLNAFRGLIYCIKNERNIRIHIVATIFIFTFSIFYKLSTIEYVGLILSIGFVIFCEIINTAIEVLVNLNSPSYDSLAKIAKDVAAGGVFLSSMVAVVVGIFLFLKPLKLFRTLNLIFCRGYFLIFIFILVFGFLFIFKGFKLKISKRVIGVDEVKIYKPKKNKFFK